MNKTLISLLFLSFSALAQTPQEPRVYFYNLEMSFIPCPQAGVYLKKLSQALGLNQKSCLDMNEGGTKCGGDDALITLHLTLTAPLTSAEKSAIIKKLCIGNASNCHGEFSQKDYPVTELSVYGIEQEPNNDGIYQSHLFPLAPKSSTIIPAFSARCRGVDNRNMGIKADALKFVKSLGMDPLKFRSIGLAKNSGFEDGDGLWDFGSPAAPQGGMKQPTSAH